MLTMWICEAADSVGSKMTASPSIFAKFIAWNTCFKIPPDIRISTRRNGRRSAQKRRTGAHGQIFHPAMARTLAGVWPSARRLCSV